MNANRTTLAARIFLMGALLLGCTAAASAQQGTDARWLPWLGCWEGENAASGTLLCIVPMTNDAGVEMVSVEQSREVSREWVRADGQQRESTREGCRGTERARFSEDGRRIYLDARQSCEGGAQQETTGLLALLSPTEWIDVRGVKVGDNTATGVSRYRLAPSDVAEAAGFGNIASDRALAVRTARVAAAARIGVDDVIDASRNVDQEVVRAWVAERREPFRLDAEQLIRMADEGVSPDVIDVVVAVSYPRNFTLGEGAQVDEAERRAVNTGATAPRVYTGIRGRFWDPFFGYYSYDPLYRYYGGGYGYGYGYGYGFPYDFRPTVVVVEPRQESQGRVVNGRGYTRSRPSNDGSAPTRAPERSSEGSSSSGSSGEGGSSSSGGGSSSGGSSTGRTAQPRPPGQ